LAHANLKLFITIEKGIRELATDIVAGKVITNAA